MSEKEALPTNVCNMQLNVPHPQRPKVQALCGPDYMPRSTESEESTDNVMTQNVTVKFCISPDNFIAQVYPNSMTINEVKQDISRRFEVDPMLLLIKQDGHLICNTVPIHSTIADEFGIHKFDLELVIPEVGECEEIPQLSLRVYYE